MINYFINYLGMVTAVIIKYYRHNYRYTENTLSPIGHAEADNNEMVSNPVIYNNNIILYYHITMTSGDRIII